MGLRPLDELVADARFGARVLRRSPLFTLTATVTLALGLGLNIAVFSVADGLLFRKLPYAEPNRLFLLLAPRASGAGAPWVPGAAVIGVGTGSRTMTALAGVTETPTFDLPGSGDAPWSAQALTEDALDVLRARPIMGRSFQPGDGTRKPVGVALVSYGAWQQRLGADPLVVGRILPFRDQPLEIVGVMPAGFYAPYRNVNPAIDLFVADEPFLARVKPNFTFLSPFVRLQDGATLDQAQAEMDAILGMYWNSLPPPQRARAIVTPLHTGMFEAWQHTFITLLVAAGLVFLLATINLANLILARGSGRCREMALRATLGASARRLSQQLAVESSLLGLVAAGFAAILYRWSYPVLLQLLPPVPAAQLGAGLDTRVLLALAGFTAVANVVFALASARQTARIDLRSTLGQASTGNVSVAPTWGRALVSVEIALATLVLVSTAVVVVSFNRLAAQPLGFEPDGLAIITSTPADSVMTLLDRFTHQNVAFERLRQRHPDIRLEAADCSVMESCRGAKDNLVEVTAGYFDLIGTPFLRGRMFTDDDVRAGAHVGVVNASYAARTWPGQDPIGQQAIAVDGSRFEIIGEIADVRSRRDTAAESHVYVPWGTLKRSTMALALRASAPVDTHYRVIAAEILAELPDAILKLSVIRDNALVTPRMLTTMFGAFGFVALVVATIGVLGIQAIVVAGRRVEIAVRIALGGHPSRVTRGIVLRALIPIAIGLGAGIITSYAATWWAASWWLDASKRPVLYNTTPRDAWAWTMASVGLAVVAIIAAWLPASRASRRDPLPALKAE